MTFRRREPTKEASHQGDLAKFAKKPAAEKPKDEFAYRFVVVGPKRSGKTTFVLSLGHCEATDPTEDNAKKEQEFQEELKQKKSEKTERRQRKFEQAQKEYEGIRSRRSMMDKMLDLAFGEEIIAPSLDSIPADDPLPEKTVDASQVLASRLVWTKDVIQRRFKLKKDPAKITEISQGFVFMTLTGKNVKETENKHFINACFLCIPAKDCVQRDSEDWQNALAIRHTVHRASKGKIPVILIITKTNELKTIPGGTSALELARLRDELGCIGVFAFDTRSLPSQEFHRLQTEIKDLCASTIKVQWQGPLNDQVPVQPPTPLETDKKKDDYKKTESFIPLPKPYGRFQLFFHRVLGGLFNFFMDHYPELLTAMAVTALLLCIFTIPVLGQVLGFTAYVMHGWLLMVKLLSVYVQFTELHLLLGVKIATYIGLGLASFGLTYLGVYLTRRAFNDSLEPCDYYTELGYESTVSRVLFDHGPSCSASPDLENAVCHHAQSDYSYSSLYQAPQEGRDSEELQPPPAAQNHIS